MHCICTLSRGLWSLLRLVRKRTGLKNMVIKNNLKATFIFNYISSQKYVVQSFLSFTYTRRSVNIGKMQWMGKSNILKRLLVFIIQHVPFLAVSMLSLLSMDICFHLEITMLCLTFLFRFSDFHLLYFFWHFALHCSSSLVIVSPSSRWSSSVFISIFWTIRRSSSWFFSTNVDNCFILKSILKTS